MSRADYPLCVWCTDSTTCIRHTEKGQTKPKKSYSIPKVSAKKKADNSDKERKERLTKFFDEMINIAPFHCQECGVHLLDSIGVNPRAIVCHILPKKTFLSVDCTPENIIYLCNLHHVRLDTNLERSMKEFKIAPLIKERVQLLLTLLTESELSKVSTYLL